MICVSVGHNPLHKIKSILSQVSMAEIRIDLNQFLAEEIKEIFGLSLPLVATCRKNGLPDEERIKILSLAIESGAAYVDIDIDNTPEFKEAISKIARQHGCQTIISYHNFNYTPLINDLFSIVNQGLFQGDLVKIACQVDSEEDCARLLYLYNASAARRKRIIALGMGEKGKITRFASSSPRF